MASVPGSLSGDLGARPDRRDRHCDPISRLRGDYGWRVPPNLRRFLPLVLVAAFLLIVLPTLLKKKSTKTGSAGSRAAQTINAMSLIDAGEQSFRAAHGGYTPHLADLLALKHRLASDLVIGLAVQLDAGSKGQTYFAQVESDVLSLVRARDGKKLIANSCLIVKSGSGVKCPV
jgi:hypothetical protein